MKLLTFETPEGPHAGLIDGPNIIDLTKCADADSLELPADLLGWVQQGSHAVSQIEAMVARVDAPRVPFAQSNVLAPFGRPPRNILCVGANYRAHAEESEQVVGPLNLPDDPVFFTKDVRSMCGPCDDLPLHSSLSSQMDWEVELGVVIGTPGRFINRNAALDHVFGYTIVNDVSFRDVQLGRSQWWMGKSFEGTSPYGPVVCTADEVPDPQDLELRCWVDGVLKQHATTNQMIHSVAALVAEVSRFVTLEPGDIISTGTPAGVGLARSPQEWLAVGSVVECEITHLGHQRNIVVVGSEASSHG